MVALGWTKLDHAVTLSTRVTASLLFAVKVSEVLLAYARSSSLHYLNLGGAKHSVIVGSRSSRSGRHTSHLPKCAFSFVLAEPGRDLASASLFRRMRSRWSMSTN